MNKNILQQIRDRGDVRKQHTASMLDTIVEDFEKNLNLCAEELYKTEEKFMKMQEKLPLPLDKIAEDLKAMDMNAMVEGVNLEYVDNKTVVTLTLSVTLTDIHNKKSVEEQYDDAMKVL